jgi:hypothetical protein
MDFNIDDFLNQTFKNLESNKVKKQIKGKGEGKQNNNNINDNKNNEIKEGKVNLFHASYIIFYQNKKYSIKNKKFLKLDK